MLNYVQAEGKFVQNTGFKNMYKVSNRDNGGILEKHTPFSYFHFVLQEYI